MSRRVDAAKKRLEDVCHEITEEIADLRFALKNYDEEYDMDDGWNLMNFCREFKPFPARIKELADGAIIETRPKE